jgi:hypothetical protein
MRKVIEENERMKRKYVFHLEEADGLDAKTTDKVLAAILKFEQSTGFKPFILSKPPNSKSPFPKQKTNAGNP